MKVRKKGVKHLKKTQRFIGVTSRNEGLNHVGISEAQLFDSEGEQIGSGRASADFDIKKQMHQPMLSHQVYHKTRLTNLGRVLNNRPLLQEKPYQSHMLDKSVAKKYKEYFTPMEKELIVGDHKRKKSSSNAKKSLAAEHGAIFTRHNYFCPSRDRTFGTPSIP